MPKKKNSKPTKLQLAKELGLLPEKPKRPNINRRKLIEQLKHLESSRDMFISIESLSIAKVLILAKAGERRPFSDAVTDENLGMVKALLFISNLEHALAKKALNLGELNTILEDSLNGQIYTEVPANEEKTASV